MAATNPPKAIETALSPSSLNKAFISAFKPMAAMAVAQRIFSAGFKIGFNAYAIAGTKVNMRPAHRNAHKNQGM